MKETDSSARRPVRSTPTSYDQLHEEAEAQMFRAAQAIMRANVEKAMAGSLAHTKWLFSIVDKGVSDKDGKQAKGGSSLARQLLADLGGTSGDS